MDKIQRLQALTGEDEVVGEANESVQWAYHVKASHIYEGTDSEDDEITTSRRGALNDPFEKERDGSSSNFEEYQLQQGELAAEGERFVTWNAIKKYPYAYIGYTNRQLVVTRFFDQGKIYDNTWDFYYLYRTPGDSNEQPLLLVPTKQFVCFLRTINRSLRIDLTLPSGASSGGFQVTFSNDGTPRPRYLGRATDREMAEDLKTMVPPSSFKPDNEPDTKETPSERSLAAFRAKIDAMMQAQKGKKLASKEKQKVDRVAKQQSWNRSIKRVQRYLGIREAGIESKIVDIRASLENSGLQWLEYDAAVNAAVAKLPPPVNFDAAKPAPYKQEKSVVFVCVDIEAYERNTSLITEIGIATLDTRDIASMIPGEGGANLRSMIRARHFRIKEYQHLQNVEFVQGCADRFEFGESEFISLRDAPHVVSTCFKHPFSKPGVDPSTDEGPKRNIILVGHDVGADISFLRLLGYDIYNLSTLQEVVDTATMWRYLKRETNSRNLGSILAELGIVGWNLHNAGNDAVYTLQAMISIAIKHLDERQKDKEVKEQERQDRIAKSVEEATIMAHEKEQGWSSAGENSDGGAPVYPAPSTKPAKKGGKYSEPPWRPGDQQKNIGSSSRAYNPNAGGSVDELTKKTELWGIETATSNQSAGRGKPALGKQENRGGGTSWY